MKAVRCFGPSSSTTRAKLRNFVALAQELSSESHEDVIRNVDKYADIGTPLRKVSPKVYQLVDEIATLDATEAKQLQDRLIKKLTAEPPKKPKGWEPFPVRARVPFPHPEALFAGIFCNRMPGVGAQTVHPLAQMMMMPHFAKMMEGQQAQQPAAAQPEAVAAAEGDGEEAEEKKEEVKTEKAIVSIKLEEFAAEKKIAVIKEIRALTGLGLKESKDLVESAPKVVKKGVARADAEAFMAKLAEIGAKISLD